MLSCVKGRLIESEAQGLVLGPYSCNVLVVEREDYMDRFLVISCPEVFADAG